MKRRALYFTGSRQVEVREEPLFEPESGQVQVQTIQSAISPGTEGLIYCNLFPEELALDEKIAVLAGSFAYPVKYGYCLVGQVTMLGRGVAPEWAGRLVFAFHPHESAFNAAPEDLIPLPPGIEIESAVFLPNMETAVNLVMDGAPVLGEHVVVFGQGIIGLLTTALLSGFPLGSLVTLDCHALRRQTSLELGAQESMDPNALGVLDALAGLLKSGADLAFELSGVPDALDQAIAVTGFAGRVVIGSWYGKKKAVLNLGGQFHRSRLKLISSQVSTVAPELSGRWSKTRRLELAWDMIRKVQPQRFVTQHFNITDAQQAYHLMDEAPESAIQIVFQY